MRALLLALPLAVCACGPPTFTVELKGEGTVMGDPLAGVLGALPAIAALTAVEFNDRQEFKNAGVTRDMVVSAQVESATLRIVDPADQDFGFLDEVQLLAKSAAGETLIAEETAVPDLGLKAPNPTLVLELVGHELAPHFGSPSISAVLRGRGRAPTRDTRLELKARLRVAYKP